ncbi:hypothetical protein SDC9_67106 [bioreactor metagenome]|uniref:Uncharacterized protein n=1 Tax=bioreactor metagenome TaxID=1076179 RepID=A0A644XWS5_9ZZZZ
MLLPEQVRQLIDGNEVPSVPADDHVEFNGELFIAVLYMYRSDSPSSARKMMPYEP